MAATPGDGGRRPPTATQWTAAAAACLAAAGALLLLADGGAATRTPAPVSLRLSRGDRFVGPPAATRPAPLPAVPQGPVVPAAAPLPRRGALLTSALASIALGPLGALSAFAADARLFLQAACERFLAADLPGALGAFDQALRAEPRLEPYLWQRGIALYYADRFPECAEQFRLDRTQNPNDTEEAVWAMLCDARQPAVGFEAARTAMPPPTNDPRPYMRAAGALFRGSGTLEDLRAAGTDPKSAFYAALYSGLYCEAQGDAEGAQRYIRAAVETPYRSSNDYMYGVAVVHRRLRGW